LLLLVAAIGKLAPTIDVPKGTRIVCAFGAAVLLFLGWRWHAAPEPKPRPDPHPTEIQGDVVDEDGRSVADATVSDWNDAQSTTSTSSGAFVLVISGTGPRVRLKASKDGYSPWNDWVAVASDRIRVPLHRLPPLPHLQPTHGQAIWNRSAGFPVHLASRAIERLATHAPDGPTIATALRGFHGSGHVSLAEAKSILAYLGAPISIEGPDFVGGILPTGTELTIWVRTYGKRHLYGVRYGAPAPGRPYFGTNDTYFEVDARDLKH